MADALSFPILLETAAVLTLVVLALGANRWAKAPVPVRRRRDRR